MTSQAPAVSIVVAAHNHARFARPLVRSIQSQTFADVEVVFLDDGSTDGTFDAWRELTRGDERFRLHQQPNAGVVATRNRGVEMARAPLVTIVDSDDVLPRTRTQRLVEAMSKSPEATMAWGDAWLIDDRGRPTGRFHRAYPPPSTGDFASELFATWCFVPAQSVMFRRQAWQRSGPFWGPAANTDYLKWIELGLLGPSNRIAGAPLGAWRQHAANQSAPSIERRVSQYHELANGLAELIRRHPQLARRLGSQRIGARLARCHFMAGFHAGLEGAWLNARAEFARARQLDPTLVNVLALGSTWPVARSLAAPMYVLAARRWLHR